MMASVLSLLMMILIALFLLLGAMSQGKKHIFSFDFGEEEELPEDALTVVIDAGHGGDDVGTSAKDGTLEKDINLAVAKKTASILEKQGFNVVMTRTLDATTSLQDRVYISNINNADIFVSLHCNYNEDSEDISGTEVYYMKQSADGDIFAGVMAGAISSNVPIKVRGTLKADFFVLNYTAAPAVLVEMGYMSNDGDAKDLKSNSFQESMAKGIAQGVIRYADELSGSEYSYAGE